MSIHACLERESNPKSQFSSDPSPNKTNYSVSEPLCPAQMLPTSDGITKNRVYVCVFLFLAQKCQRGRKVSVPSFDLRPAITDSKGLGTLLNRFHGKLSWHNCSAVYEACKLCSSSLCSLLHPPATPSLLGPNVLLKHPQFMFYP
jgi:hypothetical protein